MGLLVLPVAVHRSADLSVPNLLDAISAFISIHVLKVKTGNPASPGICACPLHFLQSRLFTCAHVSPESISSSFKQETGKDTIRLLSTLVQSDLLTISTERSTPYLNPVNKNVS